MHIYASVHVARIYCKPFSTLQEPAATVKSRGMQDYMPAITFYTNCELNSENVCQNFNQVLDSNATTFLPEVGHGHETGAAQPTVTLELNQVKVPLFTRIIKRCKLFFNKKSA